MTTQTCDSCPTTSCQLPVISVGKSKTFHHHQDHKTVLIGGVCGALVFLLVALTLAIWLRYYRPRARRLEAQAAKEKSLSTDEDSSIDPQPSSRTGSSFFSFVRGSNVIPIAYIPGVTTRHTPYESAKAQKNKESSVNTEPSIRSSIATTNYNGSTAFISLGIPAVPGRPNLVNLDGAKQYAPSALECYQSGKGSRSHLVNAFKNSKTALRSQDVMEEPDAGSDRYSAPKLSVGQHTRTESTRSSHFMTGKLKICKTHGLVLIQMATLLPNYFQE